MAESDQSFREFQRRGDRFDMPKRAVPAVAVKP